MVVAYNQYLLIGLGCKTALCWRLSPALAIWP